MLTVSPTFSAFVFPYYNLLLMLFPVTPSQPLSLPFPSNLRPLLHSLLLFSVPS